MAKILTDYTFVYRPFVINSVQYAKWKKRGVIKLNRMGGRRVAVSRPMPEGD